MGNPDFPGPDPPCLLCRTFLKKDVPGPYKMTAGGVTARLCRKHADSAYTVMRERGIA